jgi:hypothetical protein
MFEVLKRIKPPRHIEAPVLMIAENNSRPQLGAKSGHDTASPKWSLMEWLKRPVFPVIQM